MSVHVQRSGQVYTKEDNLCSLSRVRDKQLLFSVTRTRDKQLCGTVDVVGRDG